MLPYDSFLIDGPWLLSFGWFFAKFADKFFTNEATNKKVRKFLGVSTIAIFYITSISLYFNLEWSRWIWEMCRAESGRDWMINSGVLHFDHENVSAKGHCIAAALFATYPLWLKAGFMLGDKTKKA